MRNIVFLLFIILFTNCNVTKHLQDDELLINETTIKYVNRKELRNETAFKKQLYTAVKPTPNTGWLKLRLGIYQWADKKKKEKGFRNRVKKIIGEPPALYEAVEQDRNRAKMKKMLKDNGFFDSDIKIDTTIRGKKVAITYQVYTEGQYKINKVFFPKDSSKISQLIIKNNAASLVKPGGYYSELDLALERSRIAKLATDDGYLDFNEQYIFYLVDTLPGTLSTNIHVRVKMPEKTSDHQQFVLGKTRVFPNYDLANAQSNQKLDTVREKKHFYIYENDHLVNHKILDKMILQTEGEVASKKQQDASVNHLLNLGVFKFVNLKYERTGDSTQQIINRSFYLTPALDQNFSADLELNNRTGNFYGISASAGYTHRNVFKKALTFNTTLSSGLETQVGNNLGFISTLDINVQASLSTPRFILPFKMNEYAKLSLPKTTVTIGNDYQRRISLYTINATNVKLGYQWRENSRVQHSLYPISINMVNVLNKSTALDSLIDITPRLKNSFRNLFIAGLDYTHVFSNQSPDIKKDFWFVRSNIRSSGNVIQGAANLFNLSKNSEGQYQLLGLPFAQFLSLETDIRYYEKMGNSTIVFRCSPAIGLAYGNSSVLPYIEQFSVGGANSLRAFAVRSLGPGNFVADGQSDDQLAGLFIDQTGDIKLELNVEYRFPILGYLKGALFVDAGNVWLLNDTSVAGGNFEVSQFWKQIAVGSGIGFRFDTEFVVLRFDLGIPLRQPFFNQGFLWTIDRFDIGSGKWRSNNLIGNIAIGYPF